MAAARYSAVAHPATGSLGIDPVVALAPALALAGVAIIPLRGLPLLARLADKATDRGRRLAAAMVSRQIARRPIRQAGPALLVVIAVATTTLALAGYASWRQSAADQAAFAVGSDVRVDAADQLPLGATGAITRAPGVTAATSASLASIANGGNPLLTAPRQALLAVGGGGGAARRARLIDQRRGQPPLAADAERGVRRAGGGENAQAGQLCLEQCALSLPAAAAGLLAGIGLAQLMVPAITLTRAHGTGAVGPGDTATRPGRRPGPRHRGRAGRRRCPVGPAQTRPGGAVAGGGRMRTRMRTLWLRLRAAWVTLTGTGAAASVAFGLLVFASVLASLAIPRESVGLSNGALQRVIAASRSVDRTVIGTVPETSMTDETGQVAASDIAAVGGSLRARLAAGGMPVASDPPAWGSLTTGYVPATGTARAAGDGPPQFEMTFRTELARYSQIVAGRLPVGGGSAAEQQAVVQVQAAVTTTTAARFGLKVGTRLDAGPVQLVITGIIRPANPASAFWSEDAVAAKPALTPGSSAQPPYWIGTVFVGPGALPLIEGTIGTGEMQVTWVYTAVLGRVTASQASGLAASVNSLVSSGATVLDSVTESPVTVTISSQIPSILSPFISGQNAVAPALELLYVSLTVIGAVVVLLGARLVAQRRAAEFTLMRARGAALYQLAWLVLGASVVIAAAAGAVAAVLAIGLTPGDSDAVGWWLAGLTIAVTLAGPVLISVVPQRVAAPATGRPERRAAGRRPAARRIVVEIALVAVAIGGLVVLRNQGLSSGNSGLYTGAAPVLVAIPVAVVLLRCYPLLARELARIAGLSRGVVAFVGLARATRTPPGTVLPAFALVLVLAMVAFPDMVSTSVTRSQVAASWQQVGADAIIQAPPGQAIPAALQGQISSVPGVVSTATAEVDAGSLSAGTELSVMFVDPARYAAVIAGAPGPRFPLAALSGNAGSGQPGAIVPAVATAVAAQLVGTAPTSITVGTSTITIRLAGRTGVPAVPGAPGVATGVVAVVPAEASSPLVPNVMLVAGPGLDAARLSAAVSRALPGASVTLRATALAALTTAPVLQAARTALAQGLATAAGFGALILLLSLLLAAQTREMTLARLATMGLRRWQAQLLLVAETLPPVVAAAIGGVACAWLLAPLVGPSLNLAAFGGTGSAIVVTPAVFPLAASAAGLVLVALLVLAVQAVITYHRGSARALRIAD